MSRLVGNVAATFLLTSTAFASVRPYASDTIPELVSRSTLIVEVSGAHLDVLASHCATLTITVEVSLKGDVPAQAVVRAAFPTYLEMGEGCLPSAACDRMQHAYVFLSPVADPACAGTGVDFSILTVFIADGPAAMQRKRQLTTSYLSAVDTMAWAELLVTHSPADAFGMRSALAATLSLPSESAAAQRLMRKLVLTPSVADNVRSEALRALSATDSPAEAEILKDLQADPQAPVQLKRESLHLMDRSETSRLRLWEYALNPDLSSEAERVLRRSYADDPSVRQLGEKLSVSQLINIQRAQLRALLSVGDVGAMVAVAKQIPVELRDDVLQKLSLEANTFKKQKTLEKLAKENQ